MAINIRFDLAGNPEPPTIILATRSGNKLGLLDVDPKSIDLSDKFNDASEFSFTLNKYKDNKLTNLWDKVVNFKLVYCKEWDTWFEITVELDEETETVKTVFCTQLGQAELSQINLYDVEINTEEDIARDDYKISILYDENDPEASILNRMLDKAPHYSIGHVDESIKKIQRSFSFDGDSIYDGFQDVAEEIGCLFDYPSNSDENGKINRIINVYDLQQNCIDCGYRGEFTDECPKCGSKNILYGHGDDTLIYVTADELASDGIELTTDTDAVKNCFKLEAGDDLMTATVRSCNPNGTDYIWRFSDSIKEDMSNELAEKLKSYDDDYQYYNNEHIATIDGELLDAYNTLVAKYAEDNDDLKEIALPIQGYASLMNAYYNTIDLALYLQSVLAPVYDSYLTDESDNFLIDESERFLMYKEAKETVTTAEEQAELLTESALSPVSVTNLSIASLPTVNSTVLAMAKIIVKSTYKVEVNTSELSENNGIKTWTGNFVITNYSDEEDTAVSKTVSIEVNDDYENFINQKIQKALNKDGIEDVSITGLFAKDLYDFREDLQHSALSFLISYRDACQACIDILIEQGVGNDSTWSDATEGLDGNLYEKLYQPYYQKLLAIEEEIKVRESEINLIKGVYNSDGILISDGMQTHIEKCKAEIQEALDFKNYLGNELWLEFCAYRREDKYSNDNYISDGLDNEELFKRASEFFEVANKEIYKASELQHSISTTLNNLLAIPKFKPLVEHFNVGNWIRVRIDDKVYKLRLLEYGISFKDFNNISVEFSDVTKIKNSVTDVQSILSQASSMATSYSSVKRQASQGEKSSAVLTDWVENGLNATNTKFVSADNQNQVWDKNGILCRYYDTIEEKYSDEQLRIINSTIAITDDNWETTKTAIGKYYYVDPKTKELKSAYGVNGETIVGKFILGEQLSMQNADGSMTFDENGLSIENGKNKVTINPNDDEIMNITNGTEKVFNINEEGDLSINGNIMARSLTLANGVEIDSGVITNLANVAISGSYDDLINTPTKLSDFENDNEFVSKSELAIVATSNDYNDLDNTPTIQSTIQSSGTLPVNGSAVYDYALAKNQGISNAGTLLYVNDSGDVTSISIDELKVLLGI